MDWEIAGSMKSVKARIATVVLSWTLLGGNALSDVPSELAGDWKIRINAGGEIYKGKFKLSERDGKIVGTYESDEGRRTRLTAVSMKGKQIRIETRTQRFSVPVSAIFIGDVQQGKIVGEVDFSTGSTSRSNDFVATLVRAAQKRKQAPSAPIVSAVDTNLTANAASPNQATPEQKPKPGSTAGRLTFQQGTDGYRNTVDVEVWAIAPDKPLEKQGTLTSDGNNGGGESQVLMRFDEIFGKTATQIPAHARIVSAKLKVVAFDPGTTVYVHRLFVPWSSAATWNSLAAGITIDNLEASTVRDGFTFGQINMDQQSVEFDVTQTVQHWSDGEANYGWVFVNTGSNGWDFYSADWHEKELRPTLTVEYVIRMPATEDTPLTTKVGASARIEALK